MEREKERYLKKVFLWFAKIDWFILLLHWLIIDFIFTGLKSYFGTGSSGSSRQPSTRGSGIAQQEVEDGQDHFALVTTGVEDEFAQATTGVEDEVAQAELQEGITEFNPDYIISDPGLRISIDRFAPNIRDEVRRAFIAKGPFQPMDHKFPTSNDSRSF
jgi:hypothetical protein